MKLRFETPPKPILVKLVLSFCPEFVIVYL